MEWGIKLKNRVGKLLRKTYLNFIIKVVIFVTVLIMVLLFFRKMIDGFDLGWIYDWSPVLYKLVRNIFYSGYMTFIVVIVAIVGFLVLLYRLLRKQFSYVTAIYDLSDKLFDRNIEYINLPEELSELEKKLNHFKRMAIENERLAKESEQKKDELIVYLAHDIKTPLTSMIGYLSLLDEIDDMPKWKRKKYIGIALDKSYRLEELMNELFDVARFNSETIILEKEELDLNLMIEQIIDDFYPILKELNKRINFNVNEKIILYADPDKLSRVFNNLIKNAIGYSKDNSDIVVNVLKKDGSVSIEVRNKGKKIPQDKLNRLFEKFYRMDSSRTSRTGGSGLGLAIAKDIVELHKGSIRAESTEGETIFTVELPLET